MQSMFAAGVVDEVQLRVCPTTRGKGTYLFKDRRDMGAFRAETLKLIEFAIIDFESGDTLKFAHCSYLLLLSQDGAEIFRVQP